jgi:acyl carrier protein
LCVQQAEEIPRLLEHVWAFDRMAVTADDLRKTELYRPGAERRALERQALTVDEFIAGLDLAVDIAPARAEDIKRVAQLSSRVNQFNFTARLYSEPELARKVSDRSGECLVARVRDRFGDYGLVGAVVFHRAARALRIEAFFLSCRALGRGVEYGLLNEVGKAAVSRRLPRVEIAFRCTPRNIPAQDFITRVAAAIPVEHREQATVVLDAPYAAQVSYTGRAIESRPAAAGGARSAVSADARVVDASALAQIAIRFRAVKEIATALQRRRVQIAGRQPRPDADHAAVAPSTDVEIVLAGIWEEMIGVRMTDVTQDLFALGGDSLLAVRILSRIRETFEIELSLDDLFQGPLTVRSVALAVEEARLSPAHPSIH